MFKGKRLQVKRDLYFLNCKLTMKDPNLWDTPDSHLCKP